MPEVRLKQTWVESWGREAEAKSAVQPAASDPAEASDLSERAEAVEEIMDLIRGSRENFMLLMAMIQSPDASIRDLAEAVGLSRSTCHNRVVEIKIRLGKYIRFSQFHSRRSKAA